MNTTTKRNATYARGTEDELREQRGAMVLDAAGALPEPFQHYGDAAAGQRGLNRLFNDVRAGRIARLFVPRLHVLGTNLPSLLKAIEELDAAQVEIRAVLDGIRTSDPTARNALMMVATAHHRYTAHNRKEGLERARAAGASIGRPTGLSLADVQETISRMLNANNGKLPSVRKLAKEVRTSIGTAAKLLNEFKALPPELELPDA